MQWQEAPVKSTLVAFLIMGIQAFAFWLVKVGAERKKIWEAWR
jgi:hypothetical protein